MKTACHTGLCALLFALAVYGCGGDSAASKQTQAAKTEAPLAVTVTPVRTQKVTRFVEIVGTLYANEEVTISSELDGRIASIRADLGDRVARGQTLAGIDDAEFRFAIKQTESNLRENLAKLGLEKTPSGDFDVQQTSLVKRAKADFDDATLALKRMKVLHEKQLVAAQDFDTAETRAKMSGANYQSSIEEARASLAAAFAKEAQLDTARKKLRDTTIVAPLSGSISKRSVSAGEYVKVGTPLFVIVQDNPLKLRGMIPERFAPEVHADQEVEIRVDSFPDGAFKGKLTRISPSSDVTSRSFLVEGLVENPDRRLKPGFFAHAAVTTKVDPNALTVPQQAVTSFAGVSKVFVAENNVARERIVQTAGRVGTNEVEIVSGVRPGELVIISGLTRVTNGSAVKVSGPVMPRDGAAQP
ncbi:MAG TPA: efflux RND transporter periplasmic adaptor subunit [Candidatus Binatia bacterium]|jgi:RND family efflux transporter MFP subunit